MKKLQLSWLVMVVGMGVSAYAQDYTIAVRPDSSGQIYLQTAVYCGMSSMQWQVRDTSQTAWQNISGATASTFAMPASDVEGNLYRCQFYFLPDTTAKYSYAFSLKLIDSIVQVGVGEYVNRQFVYYNQGDTLLGTAFPGLRTRWGCLEANAEATEELTGIGQGRLSTQVLLDSCSDMEAAAYIVDNLVFNDHNDWYLPSLEELKTIAEMYSAIGYDPLPYTDEDGYSMSFQDRYWTANSRSEANAHSVISGNINYLYNRRKYDELGVIPSRDISPYSPVSSTAFVDMRFFQFQDSPLIQVDSLDLVRSRVRYIGEANPNEEVFTLQDRARFVWASLSTPNYFEWTDTSELGIGFEINDAGFHRMKLDINAESCFALPIFSTQFKKEIFQPVVPNSFPEVYNGVADFVDVNQDGWLDVYFNGLDTSALFINMQADSFLLIPTPFEGLYGTASVWADFNNDNLIDLLLTGYEADSIPKIYHYQQQSDGGFQSVTTGIVPLVSGSIDGFDQDNDGNVDVLITGLDADGVPRTCIYRGNGDGSFVLSDIALPAFYNSTAAIDDFNKDGFEDIALIGKVDSVRTTMVLVNHLHKFEPLEIDFPGVDHGGIHWGYLDEDDRLDFVYTGLITDAIITAAGTDNGSAIQSYTMLAMQADSFFFDVAEMSGVRNDSYAFSNLDLGDYDNDGDMDITAIGIPNAGWVNYSTGGNPVIITYRSMGVLIRKDEEGYAETEVNLPLQYTGNTFSPILTAGFESSTIGFGDFDNDGKLDIIREGKNAYNGNGISLSSGVKAERSWLYRNGSLRENEAPTAPDGLHAFVHCDSIFLSWGMGVDDHTPAAHLTYEIYIGTSPGGKDVWSPLQEREIRTTYLPVRKLQPGTYFWSVRSMDGAQVRSVYAEEQSFTIIATPDTPVGTSCDDGIPYTADDQVIAGCGCSGTLVCTTLSSPGNGELEVAQDASLFWEDIPGALGYRVSMGLTPGGGELLNGLDVGLVNSYQPGALPLGDTLFVKIIPYYEEGAAVACPETSFVVSACPPITVQVTLDSMLCFGESIELNGRVYSTSGEYLDTIWTADCPFTQAVVLEILPPKSYTFDIRICEGDTLFVNGNPYFETVTDASEVVPNVGPHACDSTITFSLDVVSEPVLFDTVLITMTTADTFLLVPNGTYASYLWHDGFTGEAFPLFGPDYAPGTYELSLRVEDEAGCIWEQKVQLLVEQSVSTGEAFRGAAPSFFPNPTDGLLQVKLPRNVREIDVELITTQGRIVQQVSVSGPTGVLDLSKLPPGAYWVRWAHASRNGLERIIVK